ncbi:Uncharacterised protein [Neisseria subflava]|nr:Uncharacterised protein [Neisseria subflava]
MSMLSIVLLFSSLFTAAIQFYFFDRNEAELKNKITTVISKQIANNLFILIFLNFPQIALWQYMRKNNILAPELLESDKLFQYIGTDFIVLSVIIFVLPPILVLSKECFPKFVGILFSGIIICAVGYGMYSTKNVTIPTSLFLIAPIIYLYGWYRFTQNIWNKKLETINIFYSIVPALILIFLVLVPDLTLESFTQNTLNRMRLGGFEVKIQTDDKRVIEGFLLLKTHDFYYLNPMCNEKRFNTDIAIISTQNTTLVYQTSESQSTDSQK